MGNVAPIGGSTGFEQSVIKSLIGWRSPAGLQARLSILIFHRVLPQPDALFPGELHALQFERICSWLNAWFNVLPLDEAARRLIEGGLPERAAAITFDDGYADNEEIALPILQRHGLNASFFVATGFLDGGRMWNDTLIEAVRACLTDVLDLSDTVAGSLGKLPLVSLEMRRHAIQRLIKAIKYLPQPVRDTWVAAVAQRSGAQLPGNLMMRSEQVRSLHRAGMRIGGHTVSHPILARVDPESARREITAGRETLQALLDDDVTLFAYPNGKPGADYQPVAVQMVREAGFAAAVSTAWGAARAGDDPYQLPRFTPWDRSRGRFGLRLWRQLM